MAKVKFKIEGMRELEKSILRLGKLPQKHVTYPVRKAMNEVKKGSQVKAPYLTGNLEKGIKLVGERSKTKGKKVYRIAFDRSMNDIFQKPNKYGKITGYYPVSQEYGFYTRNGIYIPGFRFIHDTFNNNLKKTEKIIIDEMQKRIDKEIMEEGL